MRWFKLISMKGITAESCAEVLRPGWIPCFSFPTVIITDQTMQFKSALCSTWSATGCSNVGIGRWRLLLWQAISRGPKSCLLFSLTSLQSLAKYCTPRWCSLGWRSSTEKCWIVEDAEKRRNPQDFPCDCRSLARARLRTLGKPFYEDLRAISSFVKPERCPSALTTQVIVS